MQLVVEVVGPLRVEAPRLDRPVQCRPPPRRPGGRVRGEPLTELGEHVRRGRRRRSRRRRRGGARRSGSRCTHSSAFWIAHSRTAALREVERAAPGGLVAVGEVGAEGGDRLRARAEMVVDHVEDHGKAGAVRGIDEAGEAVRDRRRRDAAREVEAVVAPAAVPGEGGDRHQLDRRDAELPRGRRRCGIAPSKVPSPVKVPDVQHRGNVPSAKGRSGGSALRPRRRRARGRKLSRRWTLLCAP